MKRSLCVAMSGMLFSLVSLAADSVIPQVPSLPAMRGSGWEDAVKGLLAVNFGEIQIGGKAEPAVQAFLGCSSNELYVLMVCTEPAPEKMVAKYSDLQADRDSDNLWKDDCVELFLATDPAKRSEYYQLCVNSKGVVADSKDDGSAVTDQGWSADAVVKASLIPKQGASPAYWLTEMRVPFQTLGGAPKPGAQWFINLTRTRYVDGSEDYSWAPITGSFHQPDLFLKVSFGTAGK